MSFKDAGRTGRDVYWTHRGVDEFGGGFLGLFLLKLTEKCEQAKKRKASGHKGGGFFDKLVDLFSGNSIPDHKESTVIGGNRKEPQAMEAK